MNGLKFVSWIALFMLFVAVSGGSARESRTADQVKTFLAEVSETELRILDSVQQEGTVEISLAEWNEPFGIPRLKVSQGKVEIPLNGIAALARHSLAEILSGDIQVQLAMSATLEFLGVRQPGAVSAWGTLKQPGRYLVFTLTRDVKLTHFPFLKGDLLNDVDSFLQTVTGITEIGARDIDFVYDRVEKRFLVHTTVTINEHDIDTFLFQATDAEQQKGWNLMFVYHDLNVSPLIRKAFPLPIGDIVIKRLAMIVSHRGIGGAIDEQIFLVQPILKEIYDDPKYELAVQKGLNAFTSINVDELGPVLGNHLKKCGLEGSMAVQGAIGGLKLSELEMSLYAMLPRWEMPAWARKSLPILEEIPGARSSFFIKVVPAALEFGVSEDVWLNLTKGEPKSKASGAVEAIVTTDGHVKFMVAASMDRWNRPLRIPGLCIEDVVVKGGVEVDAAVDVGMGGRTYINGREVGLAGDISVAWRGEVAYPQSGAFRGELSKLTLQDLTSIANTMVAMETGQWVPWNIPHGPINPGVIPDFELRDVKFEFVTPGAADPDLEFKQDGFAVRGSLVAFNTVLGGINAWISKTDGGAIRGSIHDFSYQGVDFKGALIDIALSFDELPHFIVKTGFEAFETKFDMDWNFSRTAFGGRSLIKVADLYEAEVKAEPDHKIKDYLITAYMKADFQEKIQAALLQQVVKLQQELLRQDDLLKKPREALAAARKAKDAVQQKIVDLNIGARAGQGINEVRKQLNAEKQKVNAAIGKAEKLINQLNDEIRQLKSVLDKAL